MNTHYLQKLEFNQILENLSTNCSTHIGKDIAMKLLPSNDASTVSSLLEETRRSYQFKLQKLCACFL